MNEMPSSNLPSRVNRSLVSSGTTGHYALSRNQPPKAENPLTLNFVLRALRQWWKISLPVGVVLATVAGTAVWLSFKPTYRASKWLQIKSQPEYLAFKTEREGDRFVQTQIELIRGPVVLDRILQNEQIAKMPEINQESNPLEWLKKNLLVRNVGNSEIFEISFAGPNSANVGVIVSAIVESYLELSTRENTEQRFRIIQLLTEERERRAKEVERLRESVRLLAKQLTGRDPYVTASNRDPIASMRTPLAALQERLITTEVDREVLLAHMKAVEESLKKEEFDLSEAELNERIEISNEVAQLKAQIEQKREKHQKIVSISPDHRRGELERGHQEDMRGDEAKLAELRVQLRDKIRNEMKRAYELQCSEIRKDLQFKLANLQLTEEQLRERVQKMLEGQVQSSGSAVELEFTKGELERAEGVYHRIADRVLAISTEMRAPERVILLPNSTSTPKLEDKSPLKMAGMASLAGFLLPFALAIAWERRVKRILDAQQISEESFLPVAGEIAALPMRRLLSRRRGTRNLSRARYVFEESIDSLRTSLVLSDHLKDLQTIAVVSSVSREGKTSLASQLAVSLARADNKPVLLVDADLRSPALHQIFEVPLEPGVADVLAGTCTAKNAVTTGANQLIHILPAGLLGKNPHSLVGHRAFKDLLDQFRSTYRYIVIDCPPVLCASESLVVAKVADGALLCTLREASRAPQLKLTYDRLMYAGANVIGVVLSGVPTTHYAHKYGSYAYARS